MNSINLIYLSPWSVGGFTSFTAHLYRCLTSEDVDVQVLRCNNDREEKSLRTMKGHLLPYRNVTVETAVRQTRKRPTLITAVARPEDMKDENTIEKLMAAGAKICVQSSQEFRQFPHVESLSKRGSKVVTIRRALMKHFPGSAYLPHPYDRVHKEWSSLEDRRPACSISMVASNKHPEILCGANEKLAKKYRIDLLGKVTNPFLGMNLGKKYKNFVRPKGFRCSQEATILASQYRLAVDLSDYPSGDGGGTQYSFLEAMDAGTVNIVHRNWSSQKGDMEEDINCLAASSVEELAARIECSKVSRLKVLRTNALQVLENHSAKVIYATLKKIM